MPVHENCRAVVAPSADRYVTASSQASFRNFGALLPYLNVTLEEIEEEEEAERRQEARGRARQRQTLRGQHAAG